MKKITIMKRLAVCLFVLLGNLTLAFAQQATVKIFAHRGGKLEFDENTMQAFKGVYEKGLRGFEIDIRITKDNHLVVFHDADFKRVIGVDGTVETSTLEEIKALRTKEGNSIPTADEVIEFFNARPGLYVEFEMKTNSPLYEPDKLKLYCDMLYEKVYANMPEGSDYLMTSFDTRPLKYLGDNYPEVEMLLIRGKALSEEVLKEAASLGITRVGCNVHGTNKSMVDQAKKQGFTVSLWPGHSVEDFLLGVSLGSDYLCTDVPVAVTEWVKKYGSWITLK